MKCSLTVLDTAAIQSYIFNSNELRENIGASHLVYLATTHWVEEVLTEVLGDAQRHNYRVKQNEIEPYDLSFQIENGDEVPRAEVMYAGGGNTFILFAGKECEEIAKKFVYQLGVKIIEQAPGLNLYAAHETFNWETDSLPLIIPTAMEKLAHYKNSQPVYQPLLGLGVTANCTSTQLPANGRHPDRDKNGQNGIPTLANRANRQVRAQWLAARDEAEQNFPVDATRRLRNLFPFVDKNSDFHWTDNLDKIGNLPGRDESFIAVVHADGNGMGKKMLALTDLFQNHLQDEPRLYITAVRKLSRQFRQTAQTALENTVRDLFDALKMHLSNQETLFHIDDEGRYCFPFRPVIFGGDDVTFVCAGGWGVRLAQRYLQYLEEGDSVSGFGKLLAESLDQQKLQELAKTAEGAPFWSETKPFACAGISIVKTHYPISRAYDNSEELAKSAKQMVYAYQPNKMASALDWHFTTTGLAGSLSEIRKREYMSAALLPEWVRRTARVSRRAYSLLMRPLMLDSSYTWRNWDNFMIVFTRFESGWANKRSKMMALREALREGPTAVAQFETLERSAEFLPSLAAVTKGQDVTVLHQSGGWLDWPKPYWETAEAQLQALDQAKEYALIERELGEIGCVYFDAIELQDQFFKLEKETVAP